MKFIIVLVSSFLLFVMAGCSGASGKSGESTLAKTPVSALAVKLANGNSICPGVENQLIVMAVDADGQRHITEGAGGGNVSWDNYMFQAQNAIISPDGKIKTVGDPVSLIGQQVGIRVMNVYNHANKAQIMVPITYNCPVSYTFSGQDGVAGIDGTPGTVGKQGDDKPLTGKGAGPGGNGENGSDGGNGTPGMNGSDGATVQIDMAGVPYGPQGKLMLQVMVHNMLTGMTTRHLIDPAGGTLNIVARGGNGGNGGNGGAGGAGGSAGTGTVDGNAGNGGNGGNGAPGGNGGNGGAIIINANPLAQPYIGILVYDTAGGLPGNSGQAGAFGAAGPAKSFGQPGNRGKPGIAAEPTSLQGTAGGPPTINITTVSSLW